MSRVPYVQGLYKAVATAMAAAMQNAVTKPPSLSILERDPHWPGLMPKKMEIDRINSTDHSHHMNGAKECARRRRQMGAVLVLSFYLEEMK